MAFAGLDSIRALGYQAPANYEESTVPREGPVSHGQFRLLSPNYTPLEANVRLPISLTALLLCAPAALDRLSSLLAMSDVPVHGLLAPNRKR